VAASGNDQATVLAFPVPHSDVGLVRALRTGHPDAVRALNEQYGAELLRVGMRVLGPDERLESIVCGGLARALALIEQLDNPRELRRWLITHLVFALRGHLRAQRRWAWWRAVRRVVQPSFEEPYASCSEGLITTYRTFERLDVSDRIVLTLASIDGMEPAELATILGTSVAQVRKRHERARRRFERFCGVTALG
jgi:DNA-directed RNA polymerase specialized sigma24 family protein